MPRDKDQAARATASAKAQAGRDLREDHGARHLQDQARALASGECGDPFAMLGPHTEGPGKLVVRCYHPGATRAWVIDQAGNEIAELDRKYESGFFAGPIPERVPYRLRLALPARTVEIDDPYRFPPVLGDLDMHLLAEGTHLRLYERLGAHPIEMDGIAGVSFAVWAPNARRVSVVG